jgi:predicted small lipoprotein YifL
MRDRLTIRLLLLVFSLTVCGCGQKGPLYLPETPAQQDTTDNDESPDS